MRRNIRPDLLFSMEAHVAMMEKIYEDAAHSGKPQYTTATPYLKLLTHAKHQVVQSEAALATMQERLAQAERALDDKEALHRREIQDKDTLLRQAEQAIQDK